LAQVLGLVLELVAPVELLELLGLVAPVALLAALLVVGLGLAVGYFALEYRHY